VAILGIINPCLIGYLIIVWLLPYDSLRKANRIWIVFLGTGLGLGITSSTIFLWLVIFGQPNLYYFLAEFSIVLILFLLAAYSISSSKYPQSDSIIVLNDDFNTVVWLKYLFLIILVFSLGSFALKACVHDPHGKYDAWTMWNLKARLLFHGGTEWLYVFSEDLIHTSPDYPLLLSASIFRMWVIIGTDSIAIPIIIAGFFTFGSIFLILQSLSILRGPNHGYLAAIFMLIATQYIKIGTYQYADIPLAFFILSTIILLTLKEKYPLAAFRIMFLAGLAASCAAWTKNEGLLFLALTIVVLIMFNIIIIKQLRSVKEFFYFLFGLTPILGTEIFFKLKFATPNDLVNLNNLSNSFSHLVQFDRYQQIFLKFADKVFLFNDGIISIMVVYLLFSGLEKDFFNRRTLSPLVTLLGLLFCGYFLSFLITPYDLKWHLNSALYRLIMHVWPSWVFLFFLCTKGAEKVTINEKRI
jgi:hypothetical protein